MTTNNGARRNMSGTQRDREGFSFNVCQRVIRPRGRVRARLTLRTRQARVPSTFDTSLPNNNALLRRRRLQRDRDLSRRVDSFEFSASLAHGRAARPALRGRCGMARARSEPRPTSALQRRIGPAGDTCPGQEVPVPYPYHRRHQPNSSGNEVRMARINRNGIISRNRSRGYDTRLRVNAVVPNLQRYRLLRYQRHLPQRRTLKDNLNSISRVGLDDPSL